MRKLLDVRPIACPSTLVAGLSRALPRCSVARLMATFGYAFTFGLNASGDLYQTSAIEWGGYKPGLADLPCSFEVFDVTAKGRNPAPPERLREVRRQAWTRVCASLDRGVPVLAWGAMSVEHRDAGLGAFEWSLLVGYDDERETYTVAHRNLAAPFEVSWDNFGYSDPVQWFSVIVPGDEKPASVRPVLERAVAYGRGEAKGADDAEAAGLAALELWLERVRSGKKLLPGPARFLADMRRHAADWLREVQDELGAGKRAALVEAADHFSRVVTAAEKVATREGDPAAALASALDSERRAIERLEAVLG